MAIETKTENAISPNEQKMASLAQMLGILAALPVWLVWRKRSAFVRLHAVQSMLFDVFLAVAVIVLIAVMSAGLVGGAGMLEQPNPPSWVVLALVTFGLPICSMVGLLVVLTIVLILRLRAAMLALKGQEYRYPLLGRWGS